MQECPGIDLLKPIPSQAYEYLTGEAEEVCTGATRL